jgi:hypothetical protein
MFSPHLRTGAFSALPALLLRPPLSLRQASLSHPRDGADITLPGISIILADTHTDHTALLARVDKLLHTAVTILFIGGGMGWAELQLKVHTTFAEPVMVMKVEDVVGVLTAMGRGVREGEYVAQQQEEQRGAEMLLPVIGAGEHGGLFILIWARICADAVAAVLSMHEIFGSLQDVVRGVDGGDVPGLEAQEVQRIRDFLEEEFVID